MSDFGKTRENDNETPGPSSNVQSHGSCDVVATFKASSLHPGIMVEGDMNVTGDVNLTMMLNVNPVITTFQQIDNPISKFTGRENLLVQIHHRFQECSLKTRCEERIVVLNGIGGIGKSETARKYAVKYIEDSIIQNVAWINSETEKSLKASFVSLAKTLKLEIPIDDDKQDAEQIAKDVYQHFSDHVHNGLFIFDNSLQMENSGNYFGIYKYLPTQLGFKNRPLILITARTSDWEISNENIIKIEELTQEESVELLKKKLNLTPPQLEDILVLNAISKLAFALQGYPLGLTLAASNIDNEEWNDLCSEIDNYLKRIEMPAKKIKWTDDKHSDGGLNNNYMLIMANVWEATFEKIESKGEVGKETIQLLNLISYMPPDEIKMDEVKRLFVFIFSEEIVQKCFSILSKFSLISIHKEKYEWGSTYFRIRIHRLVQHCTRTKQQEERDDAIVIQYCMYLSQQISNHKHLLKIFLYLQNYWSTNTSVIQFSILFSCGRVELEKKELRNQMRIMFEHFQDNSDNHFWLEKEQMHENKVQLMMLSLYYYQLFLKEFFAGHDKLQHCQIEREQIKEYAMDIFKTYFEYLLNPFTDVSKENQDSSEVTQKHVHQLCHETLLQDIFDNSMREPIALLTQLVDPEQHRFGRKETTEILYNLLARYFNANRECTYLVKMYWNGIVEIHQNVYSTINKNSEEDMRNYWRRGGPIHNDCNLLWFDLTSNVQLFQENVFLLNGVCEILEQRMRFICVYGDDNWEIINSLDNVMIILQILKFPEELISRGLFMNHFHFVIWQQFPQMTLYGQIQCFVTFMGFFSKNKVLMDKDGCKWSIHCVAHQMRFFYGEVNMGNMDVGISDSYEGRGKDSKEYIRDFIQLHKNDNDQETKLALQIAARFLKVKNDTGKREEDQELRA